MNVRRNSDFFAWVNAVLWAFPCAAVLAAGCGPPWDNTLDTDTADSGGNDEGANEISVSYSLGGSTFPVNWVVSEPYHSAEMVIVSVAEASNPQCSLDFPCLEFWLSWGEIPAAGSYVVGDALDDGPLRVWYSERAFPTEEEPDPVSFRSTGGTLYLEEFGYDWDDPIVGSFAVEMVNNPDYGETPVYGTVEATFDLTLGTASEL